MCFYFFLVINSFLGLFYLESIYPILLTINNVHFKYYFTFDNSFLKFIKFPSLCLVLIAGISPLLYQFVCPSHLSVCLSISHFFLPILTQFISALIPCYPYPSYPTFFSLSHTYPYLQDLCPLLLPSLYPSILQGLRDTDDDVRAIAAASLLPVSSQLTTILPHEVTLTWYNCELS